MRRGTGTGVLRYLRIMEKLVERLRAAGDSDEEILRSTDPRR